MLLLQIDPTKSGVVDKVLQITPAGLGGYGLALAVLVVVSYIFYRNWQVEQKANRLLADKVTDFTVNVSATLIRVQQRLDDSKGTPELKREILRLTEANNAILKSIVDKIN